MLGDQQRTARKIGRAEEDRELKRRGLHLEQATQPAGHQAANGQIPDHAGVDRDEPSPAPDHIDNDCARSNAGADGMHSGNTSVGSQAVAPQHRDEKRVAVEAKRAGQQATKDPHIPPGGVAAAD